MLIGVICSDERMQQVADNLSNDHDVFSIHKDTDFLSIPQLAALIFPVKGMDISGNVKIEEEDVHVPSMFWNIQGPCLRIYAGIPTAGMKSLNRKVTYYMEAEEVIEPNAILTAEGVLCKLLEMSCKSMYVINIDVIGYGRCGKAIYTMFKNLHLKVRVIRRECEERGDFLPLDRWNECGDVIVNTSIGSTIDGKMLDKWSKKPCIIDIATPDVMPLDEFKKRDMHYEKAGNLPGIYACISAGNIIADYIRGDIHCER